MRLEIMERIIEIKDGLVPLGYKKTKVGIIPNEWEVKKLKDLLRFQNGVNADKEQYYNGKKMISVIDVLSNRPIYYNTIKGHVNIDEQKLKKYGVTYGDILFQRSSETFEDVGKSNVYLDQEKVATFSGFVIRGKKIGKYHPIYFNELLKTQMIRKQIIRSAAGSQHVNISQDSLSKIMIYIASLDEQKTISEILSIQDNMNELKDKLISKKKKEKKYLRQLLLAGKIQPESFKGGWKKVKLKKYLIECVERNKNLNINNVLSVNNKLGFIKQKEQFSKTVASKDLSNYKIISKNYIAYNPSRINVGSIAIYKEENQGIVSPMYVVLKTTLGLNDHYFIEFTKSHLFTQQMKSFLSGSVRNSLSFNDICNMYIVLPSIEEQVAIVDVLSKEDKEIELLEKEIEKEKEKKKALMQLLLTGIVRV